MIEADREEVEEMEVEVEVEVEDELPLNPLNPLPQTLLHELEAGGSVGGSSAASEKVMGADDEVLSSPVQKPIETKESWLFRSIDDCTSSSLTVVLTTPETMGNEREGGEEAGFPGALQDFKSQRPQESTTETVLEEQERIRKITDFRVIFQYI